MRGLHHHHLGHGYISSDMAELILSYLPQGGVAADLGCGSGRFCQVLLSKASKVYCVDIDEYALNVAKENIKDERAVFLNEDASSTSIPTGSVDLVIMVNSFHDMEDKGKVTLEVGRILKQGGFWSVFFIPSFVFSPSVGFHPSQGEHSGATHIPPHAHVKLVKPSTRYSLLQRCLCRL